MIRIFQINFLISLGQECGCRWQQHMLVQHEYVVRRARESEDEKRIVELEKALVDTKRRQREFEGEKRTIDGAIQVWVANNQTIGSL